MEFLCRSLVSNTVSDYKTVQLLCINVISLPIEHLCRCLSSQMPKFSIILGPKLTDTILLESNTLI